MKRFLIASTTFVAVLAIAAGIFWVGGFNFDRRDPGVAWGLFFALIVAGLFACRSIEEIQ